MFPYAGDRVRLDTGRRRRPSPGISEPSRDALSGHRNSPRSPKAELGDLWGWA